MSKIREGVAEKIYEWCKRNDYIGISLEWKELQGATRGLILAITDIVLEYEGSQGVVIKVERELLPNPYRNAYQGALHLEHQEPEYSIYRTAISNLLKAGYVAVEPLIEGVKVDA